jgi:general secretion pathway protein D
MKLRRSQMNHGQVSMKHSWLRTAVVSTVLMIALGQAWPTPAWSTDADGVTLNFVDADIRGVAKAVGQITGRNFVIDSRVSGTINIVSAQPISRDRVFDVFLSALRLQGFAAIEDRDVVKIVPEADAKTQRSTAYGPHEGSRPGGDRIQTRVFVLKHESAAQLVPTLRPE